ncbi:MAG: sulfatase [Planctomycetes bacterium]|nr:sulfatase [Planctomycetota bacterium]
MRKFYFVICSAALASAIIGLMRAAVVMIDSNWLSIGDGNLLWLHWANDIGVKRMLLSVPIAILLTWFAGKFILLRIFHNAKTAIVCVCLALLPHLVVAAAIPSSAERPTVIMITLDSVRLDHLGWGGCELPTSPKLDSLAAAGIRFTQNISQSSWTKPSTATLLTGLVPSKHRANSRYGPLPNSQRTLAEAFSLAGYRTNCLSSNPNITPTFGFAQGFDNMHHNVFSTAKEIVASGSEWLNAENNQASFLYLHLNDAHYPYRPSKEYAGMFNQTGVDADLTGSIELEFRHNDGETISDEQVESLRLSYAEEIRYLDDVVGDFVSELLNTRDDVIVIITSDHGEEFLEHGDLGHGHTVYDELIRIPLQFSVSDKIMAERYWEKGSHPQQVRQIDVLPTVLEMCGISWPTDSVSLDGHSLLPFFNSLSDKQISRNAWSETDSEGSALSGYSGPLRSLREPGRKLIFSDPWRKETANRVWFFNLIADPQEQKNIAENDQQQCAELFDYCETSGWLLPHFYDSSVRVTMSNQEKAQLAAMGYTDDVEDENSEQAIYFAPSAVPWSEIKLKDD